MDHNMQQLVLQFIPLANKLAYQKKRSLPSFIDVEELKSAAYLGLVEAASRFNPEFGTAFSTFAYPRIFGAIQDYLRSLGWGRRDGSSHCVSLDAPNADGHDLNDMLEAKTEENDEFLEVVSVDLNDQARQILRLYFVESYSMKEIGERFDVTESRISQLIKQYRQHIRGRWDEKDLRLMLAA